MNAHGHVFGASSSSINLDLPFEMWANRFGIEANTIDGSFETNVLWLEGPESKPVVLIAIDALYASRELITKVEEFTNSIVDREHLVFFASHTHFGPILSSDKPGLGVTTPDEVVAQYAHAVSSAIERARQNRLILSSIHLKQGLAGSVVNRRRRRAIVVSRKGVHLSQTIMAPNPKGRTNNLLSIVEFLAEDGQVNALLWHWTCHPTAFPSPGVATPEYPGFVRDHLRTQYNNPELPVLFLQGFSGDQRPPEPTKTTNLRESIAAVLRGPTFQAFSESEYQSWLKELFAGAEKVVALPATPIVPQVKHRHSESSISNFIKSAYELPDLICHRVDLSDSLGITGISAEVVLDHEDHVNDAWSDATNICVGCTGDVYGYMPTDEMVVEGGYEVDEFCESFGYGESTANPNTNTSLLATLLVLAENARDEQNYS